MEPGRRAGFPSARSRSRSDGGGEKKERPRCQRMWDAIVTGESAVCS